jgi:hypothetical protein
VTFFVAVNVELVRKGAHRLDQRPGANEREL